MKKCNWAYDDLLYDIIKQKEAIDNIQKSKLFNN